MAEQFGIDQKTALKASKQAEALGTETLQRTAKLPAFDGPSSLDALVAMDADPLRYV